MKLFEELNEETFALFASKYYKNTQCTSIDEFYDDINRIKYIKRLLRKYKQTGSIQERLLLNHFIIFFNVFDIEAARKMIWFKIEEDLWPQVKTFLVYLNYLPEEEKVEVPLDSKIVDLLRKA